MHSPIARRNSYCRFTLVLFCNAHKLAASEHERTAVGGRARNLLHPHVRLVCWPRVIRFRAHVREQQRGRRGAGTNARSMTSCVHATPVPKSDQTQSSSEQISHSSFTTTLSHHYPVLGYLFNNCSDELSYSEAWSVIIITHVSQIFSKTHVMTTPYPF